MALDEARTRQRIAAALLAARARLGGGDARRFPQPKMADLLGVSLRTYQHWESAENMPRWRNLEEIADKLAIPVSDLVGEPEPVVQADEPANRDEVRALREELGVVRGLLAELLARGQPEIRPAGKARRRSA